MIRRILFAAMLLTVIICQAQIKVPATYTFTKKVNGDMECDHITSYLIFKSTNDVILCIKSWDNYIFPVAFGKYNPLRHSILFKRSYSCSTWGGFYPADTDFTISISEKNGAVFITSSCDNINYRCLNENGPTRLTKCDYNITQSDKLVGSSWRYQDETTGVMLVLYFKSINEVLVNGESRDYIFIGNSLGFLSGDNAENEALVGNCYEQSLQMHPSGYSKKDYPWFTLKKLGRGINEDI